MTAQQCKHRHSLQILGALGGILIPLLACAMLLHVEFSGRMPMFAGGVVGTVLLVGLAALANWIWAETV